MLARFHTLTRFATRIHTAAVHHSAPPHPLAPQIAAARADGTDIAAAMTRRFIDDSISLLAYRLERLGDEAASVGRGEFFRHYDWQRLLHDLRFVTQMLFVYLVAVMVGRDSVFPLLAPGSRYAEGQEYYAQYSPMV